MPQPLAPDSELREYIESGAHAQSNMCWTCSTCDLECPMNIASGRLRPQKVVRMANLGMLDELVHLPELWYCLTCRRCLQVCPNEVKPALLIEHLRREAVRQGVLSWETLQAHQQLFAGFQRARWHAIDTCMQGKPDTASLQQCRTLMRTPVPQVNAAIPLDAMHSSPDLLLDEMARARVAACFTCGECSSACPVSGQREVFDPRTIFRMVHLGLFTELLHSPSIWICVACGRCTDVCSQLVDGRRMIQKLQQAALDKGIITASTIRHLEAANRALFNCFCDQVDALLERPTTDTAVPSRLRSRLPETGVEDNVYVPPDIAR